MKLYKTIIAALTLSCLQAEEQSFKFNNENAKLIERVVKGTSIEVSGYFQGSHGAIMRANQLNDNLMIKGINNHFAHILTADKSLTPYHVQDVIVIRLTKEGHGDHILLAVIETKEEGERISRAIQILNNMGKQDGVSITDMNIHIHGEYAGTSRNRNNMYHVIRGELIIRTAPKRIK